VSATAVSTTARRVALAPLSTDFAVFRLGVGAQTTMAERSPTSVLLPTVEWTDACEEVAAQLAPDDELLIVHDDPSDPVADRAGETPENVRFIAAGDPSGCSGKANAIAEGMEAARRDRIVWTDDDFRHPPDWLDRLNADYDERGPTTEVPHFVGRDPLSALLEPHYLLSGTMTVAKGGIGWGGALIFERDDVDDAALLRDLRRTVSDDGVLSDHLEFTAAPRRRRVAVGGAIGETLERHVRFTQIAWRHGTAGVVASAVLGAFVTVPLVLFPVAGVAVATLLFAALYASLGVRRWTVLLAYPSTVLQIPLFLYALARPTFVWGGRRYRWRSKYDVEIVE
jgi:hypothetical protein